MVGGGVVDVTRSRAELIVENMLLRQQLVVLQRQMKRPKLTWRDRLELLLLARLVVKWKDALKIVQPEAVLRWHRDLYRLVWRRKSRVR